MNDSRFRPLRWRALFAILTAVILALPLGCQPPPGSGSPNVTDPNDSAVTGSDVADSDSDSDGDTEVIVTDSIDTITTPADADLPQADDEGGKTAAAGPSSDGASGAKLSGRVVFEGTPPERRAINMSKDAKCIELHGNKPVLDEAVLIGENGGVQNAFVYIRRGAPKMEYPAPDEPARLDQKECMYRPRVQGILVGQKLLVGNNDPVTHNVRSFPVQSRPFNFGQPPGSEPRERVFDVAEREIEVQCDIHPWMHAYVFVMDHPYFCVTGEDGSYTIDALPPGEYTVEAWHEQLGRQRQTVTVAESDVTDSTFTYKP